MEIEVRFRALDSSEALRDHTERQLHAHLDRFGDEVTAAVVRISDVNGPKGGVDKRCQVTVHGPLFGSATLDDMTGDAYSSVDLAVERIGRAVAREIDRARTERRTGDPLRTGS